MKTTKTLLALIAVAAMVACSKDDVSYGDLDGTYEASKIIYSFDGNTIATITPGSEDWEYELDIEKLKFEGKNVTVWDDMGYFYTQPYVLDDGWISFGFFYRIEKSSKSLSMYWYPYLDEFGIDEAHNPKYDEESIADADIIKIFKGKEIYWYDDADIAFYYKNGKPVFCYSYDYKEENYYDTIEYIYKKK